MARSYYSDDSSSERRCRKPGCGEKHGYKQAGGQRRYSLYCADHTCKAEVGDYFCQFPRDADGRYCEHHECSTVGCQKPKAYPDQHCGGHLRCTLPQCPNPRSANKPLCLGHSCQVERCGNVSFAGRRCFSHQPCAARGCQRFKVRVGDVLADFCDQHDQCATRGCGNIIGGGYVFCQSHACRINGCKNERKHNQFCDAHTCRVHDCPAVVVDTDNPAAHFCNGHKCHESSCLSIAARLNGYCRSHACVKDGCAQKQTRHGPYCQDHECKADNCSIPAKVPKGYCDDKHACSKPRCPHKRDGDRDYPNLCREHLKAHCRDIGKQIAESEAEAQLEDVMSAVSAKEAEFEAIRRENERLARAERQREEERLARAARLREEERAADEERRREAARRADAERQKEADLLRLDAERRAAERHWQQQREDELAEQEFIRRRAEEIRRRTRPRF